MSRAMKSFFVVFVFVLAAAGSMLAAAKDKPIDFSGTWKLNMKQSRGAPDWRPDTVLVVLQSPYQIHFAFFLNSDVDQPFQKFDYVTNGKERQLYATGNEIAYGSARWSNNKALEVRTHHVVRAEIADTEWTETETWVLSPDGKTLTNKSSDKKVIVYDKQDRDKAY